MNPISRTGLRCAAALLLATACESAWASKFATGLEGIFYFVVLGATAGMASIASACLGRSRTALAIGLCIAPAAAFHWMMPIPIVSWDGAANRLPAAAAAALGCALGWAVTRWKRLRPPMVTAILVQNALAVVLYFGEPIFGLLCACLSAFTLPLLAAIGLGGLRESLAGARPAPHRADASESPRAPMRRLRDMLRRAWHSPGVRRAQRAAAEVLASCVAAVRRSRSRRAYVTGLSVYLGGFALAGSDSRMLRRLAELAMRPGHVLHAMLTGDLPPWPEPPVLAWSIYGLACSVAIGVATLGLRSRSVPPGD